MTEPTYVYRKGEGWVLDIRGPTVFLYTDINGIVVKAEYRKPMFGEFYYRAGVRPREDEKRCLEHAKIKLPSIAYANVSKRKSPDDDFYDNYYCIVLTPHV